MVQVFKMLNDKILIIKRTLKIFSVAILLLSGVHSAMAGGVLLGATRVIYMQGDKQASLAIKNTDDKLRYLIQSWVEDKNGKKSTDFIVTPPLFVSNPKAESTLRIVYVGSGLPADKESVYYLNSKAIPEFDKDKLENKNVLKMAVLSRIKLYVRPANLSQLSESAPESLKFHFEGNQLTIDNPTPYYVSMVQFYIGGKLQPNTLVSPKDKTVINIGSGLKKEVTFKVVNDYGAITKNITGTLY